jgi:hypothetical protein
MIYDNAYPLSAQDMTYDFDEHKYVLNLDYVRTKTGVDLVLRMNSPYIVDKTTAANSFLRTVSEQIYAYVYSYNLDNDYQEYLMAKSPLAREALRSAMLAQIGYILRNGKIDEYVGINLDYVNTSANTSLDDLRGQRSIHPQALQSLRRTLEYGDKLLYNGEYWYNESEFSFRSGY